MEAELCDFAWNDCRFLSKSDCRVYSHFKIGPIPLHRGHNRLTAQLSENLTCVKYKANSLFYRQNERNDYIVKHDCKDSYQHTKWFLKINDGEDECACGDD